MKRRAPKRGPNLKGEGQEPLSGVHVVVSAHHSAEHGASRRRVHSRRRRQPLQLVAVVVTKGTASCVSFCSHLHRRGEPPFSLRRPNFSP